MPKVIDSLRPWWVSFGAMGALKPPIDIPKTATLLFLLALAGSFLMIAGGREIGRSGELTDRRWCTDASLAAPAAVIDSHLLPPQDQTPPS